MFSIKGKPFFIPWSDTDIAYDSLLGVALTIKNTNINNNYLIYLEKYKKTKDHLSAVFTYASGINTSRNILAYVDTYINKGVSTINIEPTELLLSGNITVIEGVEEYTEQPTQISPAYIKYYIKPNTVDTIKIDDTLINVNEANIVFDSLTANVEFDESSDGRVHAYVVFKPRVNTTIDNRQLPGISTFAGKPITYNETSHEYEGVLKLPSNFTVKKVNSTFALITPYTYETCKTGEYIYKDLGNISCDVYKSDSSGLPLSECFDVTDETYTLNPYRIDDLRAPDKVKYWELNKRH